MPGTILNTLHKVNTFTPYINPMKQVPLLSLFKRELSNLEQILIQVVEPLVVLASNSGMAASLESIIYPVSNGGEVGVVVKLISGRADLGLSFSEYIRQPAGMKGTELRFATCSPAPASLARSSSSIHTCQGFYLLLYLFTHFSSLSQV